MQFHPTCRVVIPTKLDFGAPLDFIYKASVTMHGHTIISLECFLLRIRFKRIHFKNAEGDCCVEGS